ncbi:hypothetical protein [Bradyrhizobium sp. JYMT SZCCT0180]|uniref:hypothetical protein n=1 Tax=Bradyrhizobium sp. JYMT SZCCT0180 TaxID=2807666 RepID=UPI001BA47879|nr:hypothetical protein [Bradyrhizobium sp. JYMT SZCCT0180]MBR1214619.1 hypothetical protein [Bradyrhizobium sp. JYMT SZCCT0180]
MDNDRLSATCSRIAKAIARIPEFMMQRRGFYARAIDQVWLLAPGIAGIRLEDDSISWTVNGPDLALGAGLIQGEVGLAPELGLTPGDPVPMVLNFLTGLLTHGGVSLAELP